MANAPELVFETPSGELFLQGDSNRGMLQHRGELLFPEERVAQWRDDIIARDKVARAIGAEFIFLVGPDKQSVYWPAISTTTPDHRNVLSVLKLLPPEISVVDPVAALIAADKTRRVFPRTDTHWDMAGAYVAYREVMARSPSQKDAILKEGVDFEFIEAIMPGDLGKKQIPPSESAFARVKRLKPSAKLVYSNGLTFNGIIRMYRKPNAKGVGVVCGDSYSQHFVRFVAEHFEFCLHVRGSHFDAELMRRVKPGLIITQVAERYMIRPPILPQDAPTEMLAIRKLVSGDLTQRLWDKIHVPLADRDLPESFLAATDRQDALGETVREDATGPGDAGRKFAGDAFKGAGPADAVVATFVARRYGLKQSPSWLKLFRALPESVRAELETGAVKR